MMKRPGLWIAGAAVLAVSLGLAPTLSTARAEFFEYTAVVTVDPITGISSVSGNGIDTVALTTNGGDTSPCTAPPPAVRTTSMPAIRAPIWPSATSTRL